MWGYQMLIRSGDIITGLPQSAVFFGLEWESWVYNVDPNPPSEATFVLLMFIGSAILIYAAGWCLRYVISGKKNITGR